MIMASCLANNASPFLVMLSMCLLICFSEAKQYVVGGSANSWKTPLSSPDSLNHWANSHHFKIGDTLVFKYDERTESVHEVNETDYERCNTVGQEHVVFNDGNTKVLLTKSGFRHFISGNQSHCRMGLKLAVVVITGKTKNNPTSPTPTPTPSPSPSPSPSPLSSTPSPSPSPLPNNHGVNGSSSAGFIMMWLLGVMMLLV
ncbi:early nodulin-55-2 [Vigna unguiculata]|uniref:Cupredoxin n=1 Tax=Vigna unguiculata TaxID=3917 RepID=A0A4D6KUT6_VIGUN|nr:early nodulin-55-2 [Vigna unguiculata]QCD80500.1 Cupredoxin [Vigna unguiculata]